MRFRRVSYMFLLKGSCRPAPFRGYEHGKKTQCTPGGIWPVVIASWEGAKQGPVHDKPRRPQVIPVTEEDFGAAFTCMTTDRRSYGGPTPATSLHAEQRH